MAHHRDKALKDTKYFMNLINSLPLSLVSLSTGGREMLNYFCEQIPGDAMLYSMFRIDSEPVKCPPSLKGNTLAVQFV